MVEQSLLLTDLYQFSMREAYAAHGMADSAVFELFVRKLPLGRGFLIAAGLGPAGQLLGTMRFTPDHVPWLRESHLVSPGCVETLRDLRFTGDVDAMPEGTVFF